MAFMLGDFTSGLFGGLKDGLAIADDWEKLKLRRLDVEDRKAMIEAADAARAAGDEKRKAPPIKTSTEGGGTTGSDTGGFVAPDLNSVPQPDYMTRKPGKSAVQLYTEQQGVSSAVNPTPAPGPAKTALPDATMTGARAAAERAIPGAGAAMTAPIRDASGATIGAATPGTTAMVTPFRPVSLGQAVGVVPPQDATQPAPAPTALPAPVTAPAPQQRSMGGIPTLGSALGWAAPAAPPIAPSAAAPRPQSVGQWLGVTPAAALPVQPPAYLPPGAQTSLQPRTVPTLLAALPVQGGIEAQIMAALNGRGVA